MRPHFLVSTGLAIVLIMVASLPSGVVAGQAAPAAPKDRVAAKSYTPTRTPDGQPDMQGFWTNSTYTPLERPDNVTREFYTQEEALEAEKKAAAQESEQTTPG